METPQDKENTTGTSLLNEFMNALQRVFKIAIYYPTGHVSLDAATQRFMTLLVTLAADTSTVTLQAVGESIHLQEIEMSRSQPFVKELLDVMQLLGIAVITIDRHISMAETHTFIRKLLEYKGRIINSKQFTQLDISDMPHSVTILQTEFLARTSATQTDDTESQQSLEDFSDSLAKYGLNLEEIDECKTLLHRLPQHLENSSIPMENLPYASWDDVARLLINVVKARDAKEVDGPPPPRSSINTIANILKQLEKETSDTKSRKALNLLVKVVQQPREKIRPTSNELRVFPKTPAVSLAKIDAFAQQKSINTKTLKQLAESVFDNEILSIQLQLAQRDLPLQVQIKMQQLFREHLSGEIKDSIWNILSHGLHSLLAGGEQTRISATIKLILEPLRRNKNSYPLLLMQKTDGLCDREEATLLWPYIVNELLVAGCSSDRKTYHDLCRTCARLPLDKMAAQLTVLRNLDSFTDTKIASDIFTDVSLDSYPLFAFLYKTEIERFVGERVIGGLKRTPRDWLIKGVAPLLNLSQQHHKIFLYSYLRQAAEKALSPALQSIAAKIIAETMPTLSDERRNEKWVESTIAAMGNLPGSEMQDLLHQIAGQKKLLFLHEWPPQCRKEAETTLAKKRG